MQTEIIPEEDVFFTGIILRNIPDSKIINDDRFTDDRPILTDFCYYREYITVHHMQPEELQYIWRNRKNTCHFYSRIFNGLFYNIFK